MRSAITGVVLLCTVSSVAVGSAVPPRDSSYRVVPKPPGWDCDGFDCRAEDGPGAARVILWFKGAGFGGSLLREGNSRFGYKHISKGGSTNNKTNHPVDAAAVKLWEKAHNNFSKGSKSFPYRGGMVSTYKYTSGGKKRTMCVVEDGNDFVYGGKNNGIKGVITAYWVSGHVGAAGCAKD
ncbi:hypothetical protein GTW40_27690 [Streptomyces sp. SID4985]|uniref:hypothetical protein n=1 Tax=Streptomyces sp. SID4985 TaxID=2690292 RepID=UPI00136F3160|nr:hypothetical protein [Streptomyces sp. SID4985]MYQ48770.1 hypothetical protein [Streptomyces sp. SID4985]